MASVTPGHARVIVFTDRHTLLAELNTGQRRVSDVVNDQMKKHLVLEHIRLNRSDKLDEAVAAFAQAVVKKDVLQGILIMSEPPRPPQQRLANYVPKSAARIAVLLPAFLIVGSIYLTGKVDPSIFVLEGPEPFAVISNAEVTLTSRSGPPIAVPTAVVNRSHIELAGQAD